MTVSITRKFVDTDFGCIHLRIAGNPKTADHPLVCLHMTPLSGREYEPLMQAAAPGQCVIAPDYPGYGDSSSTLHSDKVSIEAYAQSIWQSLDALGIRTVDLFGYHTGSKVAVEMSTQNPDRVRNVVCVAIATMTAETYHSTPQTFEPLSLDKDGEGVAKWWRSLNAYYDPALPIENMAKKLSVSLQSGNGFHLGFKASYAYNAVIVERLKALEVPVALININDDLTDVTPKALEYLNHGILLDRPKWIPGYLDTRPSEIWETIAEAFDKLAAFAPAKTPLRAV